jgi:hypothetical protein
MIYVNKVNIESNKLLKNISTFFFESVVGIYEIEREKAKYFSSRTLTMNSLSHEVFLIGIS